MEFNGDGVRFETSMVMADTIYLVEVCYFRISWQGDAEDDMEQRT